MKAVQEAELTSIRCLAHTINLASNKALKLRAVDNVLVKVRRVVSFFHRSPKAAAVLKEKQELKVVPEHKLIIDVATRWNSSYDMLERYREQSEVIPLVLLELKQHDLLRLITDDTLISTIDEILQVSISIVLPYIANNLQQD